MKTFIVFLLACGFCLAAMDVPAPAPAVPLRIETELGPIIVELYPDKAPLSCANFLRYVDAGLYDGTTFFRTVTMANQPTDALRIEVIQGGDMADERAFPPIAHESTQQTGLHHRDGAVSMARAAPGTASCSFFICIGDQPALDFGGRRNPDGQGFAAFGQVTAGMEVVRAIHGRPCRGQALEPPVKIVTIRRVAPGAGR
jgi:peptidyl-prolyl cis-trans isomerase A (cyclophilin A)